MTPWAGGWRVAGTKVETRAPGTYSHGVPGRPRTLRVA